MQESDMGENHHTFFSQVLCGNLFGVTQMRIQPFEIHESRERAVIPAAALPFGEPFLLQDSALGLQARNFDPERVRRSTWYNCQCVPDPAQQLATVEI